jgi:hypothetical protein
MINIISQFLPIILLFIIVSNNRILFEFSNTILGKIIAIVIIIFYISIDKIIGIFVCALIILFYQSHYRENMDIIYSDFYNDYTTLDNALDNDALDNDILDNDYIDDYIYLYPKDGKNIKKNNKENFNESLEDKFRRENCKNGVLMFKNINVNNEMSEFVFPEMKFNNDICNPCNKTCDITIHESTITST